jgi:hypothetical protein
MIGTKTKASFLYFDYCTLSQACSTQKIENLNFMTKNPIFTNSLSTAT